MSPFDLSVLFFFTAVLIKAAYECVEFWKEEDEIYEHWMCLYDRNAERWNEKPYCRRHPREWEHYWLHPHLEIYLASRGEIAFMIEKSG